VTAWTVEDSFNLDVKIVAARDGSHRPLDVADVRLARLLHEGRPMRARRSFPEGVQMLARRLLSDGLPQSEVARRLGVTDSTVARWSDDMPAQMSLDDLEAVS